jgi:hypothetical protein
MKLKYANKPVIIFLFLQAVLLHAYQEQESSYWWQIKMHIIVSGEYAYRIDDKGFDGNYSFSAELIGTMLEDGEDYFFLQVFHDIQKMKWKETVFNGNQRSEIDLPGKIKPGIAIEYVLHNRNIISFAVDTEPVTVPLCFPFFPLPTRSLRFPKSAGDASVGTDSKYNKKIIGGSNRVEIQDRDIYDNVELNKSFEWNWKESTSNPSWVNSHHVKVNMEITRNPGRGNRKGQ